jgi:imidazolonepropionase-like amidohydrolase
LTSVIRELNHAGVADLPDVVAAGYQVVRQLPELFFVDFPHLHQLMNGVSGPAQVTTTVEALAGRRVNVIKLLATERLGLPETNPRRRMLADEEIEAAMSAARKNGIPVMAHAHSDDGIAAAVRAGARSIEHGSLASGRTISLMRERGTFLVPTVASLARNQTIGGPRKSPVVAARSREFLPHVRTLIAKARRAGVRIVAGSDERYAESYPLQDEVAELVHAGLTPMEAIKAATSVAAECLLVHERTGAIRPGLEADLIAVAADPTNDVGALKNILLVVNNGKVALDGRGR